MTEPPGVRERLQREYGLTVLRLSMGIEGGAEQVLFSVSMRYGEEAALLTATLEELGLDKACATTIEGSCQQPEPEFHIPGHIIGALRQILNETEQPGAPLWIRLSPPLGLLTAVPWESILQPALGVSILRLPYHMISPRAPELELDSVICFSSPVSQPELERQLVDNFIAQIPVDLAKYTTFHLFADLSAHTDLLEIQRRFGSQYRIKVYDPCSATRRDRKPGENPWLAWMRTAMGGRSADVVHFLCHCCRIRDEGTLALAETPVRNENLERAGLVTAAEVVDFLNATGAWSLAFTSPPSNASAIGMRMLQDCVVRLRPGPVLLHDMAHPDGSRGLEAAYRFLYMHGQPAPSSPAISLYCHPVRHTSRPHDEQSAHLLNEYTLSGRLGDRLRSSKTPAWLASSQRVLEASAGELAAAMEADPSSGRKRARSLVLDALAEYAQSPESEDTESK